MMATDTIPANVIKDSTIMAKLERSARPPEGSSLWDRFLWDWKGKSYNYNDLIKYCVRERERERSHEF